MLFLLLFLPKHCSLSSRSTRKTCQRFAYFRVSSFAGCSFITAFHSNRRSCSSWSAHLFLWGSQ
uniref:Secreted protein n=1 Tax=Arundo donax TaxID=35708 RepID=A0A0A9F625_ARUDO